jgi:hypothetical protein
LIIFLLTGRLFIVWLQFYIFLAYADIMLSCAIALFYFFIYGDFSDAVIHVCGCGVEDAGVMKPDVVSEALLHHGWLADFAVLGTASRCDTSSNAVTSESSPPIPDTRTGRRLRLSSAPII